MVTDEQHRFGVAQRGARRQGEPAHPGHVCDADSRTLAVIYGDLDISILDELPPGGEKIKPHRRLANGSGPTAIAEHLESGRQGYIVCPLVEEGRRTGRGRAYKAWRTAFRQYRVGLLHGRLGHAKAVMRDFLQVNCNCWCPPRSSKSASTCPTR